MNQTPLKAEMEQAFLQGDGTYDGIFYVGVKTTGIFCRPSCSARKPKMENIEYFSDVRGALYGGYRPCKRCHPLHIANPKPEWVVGLLAEIEKDPTRRWRDQDLRNLSINPATARRYFQSHYGMTFQAYSRGRRLNQAFARLRKGSNLDAVMYDSGYESSSGFRDAFSQAFGQPAGQSEKTDLITMMWMESPLGPLVAGTTEKGICFLEFTDRRMLETQFKGIQKHFGRAIVPGKHDHLEKLKVELKEYFEHGRKTFAVPLDYPGTEFQKKVWNELRNIEYGQTCSYEHMAIRLGNPKAKRAVGRANGTNRISIVIPCHRVVNKDGKLGGYGGGLWRKQYLLNLERGTADQSTDLFN